MFGGGGALLIKDGPTLTCRTERKNQKKGRTSRIKGRIIMGSEEGP